MATIRWMGVPEAEVRMVEGTYEKTTARIRIRISLFQDIQTLTYKEQNEA